jgi:hypothetical protein
MFKLLTFLSIFFGVISYIGHLNNKKFEGTKTYTVVNKYIEQKKNGQEFKLCLKSNYSINCYNEVNFYEYEKIKIGDQLKDKVEVSFLKIKSKFKFDETQENVLLILSKVLFLAFFITLLISFPLRKLVND